MLPGPHLPMPPPPEVDVVFKFILPLAIPMLLLSANIFRILRETGQLLKAFLLGGRHWPAGQTQHDTIGTLLDTLFMVLLFFHQPGSSL